MGELDDKVKDLERKVANLFNDNMALKTKLEASREVERQQQEEIAHLTERLVQAQVNMHFRTFIVCISFEHILVHNRTPYAMYPSILLIFFTYVPVVREHVRKDIPIRLLTCSTPKVELECVHLHAYFE